MYTCFFVFVFVHIKLILRFGLAALTNSTVSAIDREWSSSISAVDNGKIAAYIPVSRYTRRSVFVTVTRTPHAQRNQAFSLGRRETF